jgi:TolB-like protein
LCCHSRTSATTGSSNISADGITEDLTTDLSRIAGMLVISRNPAFTYRNKTIDTKQSGRELGVRYVLEGACAGRAIESGSMLN